MGITKPPLIDADGHHIVWQTLHTQAQNLKLPLRSSRTDFPFITFCLGLAEIKMLMCHVFYRRTNDLALKTRSTSRHVRLYLMPRCKTPPSSITFFTSSPVSSCQFAIFAARSTSVGGSEGLLGDMRSSNIPCMLQLRVRYTFVFMFFQTIC